MQQCDKDGFRRFLLQIQSIPAYLFWVFWVFSVDAGAAGTCAGQSLPCSLLRRQQEAGQSTHRPTAAAVCPAPQPTQKAPQIGYVRLHTTVSDADKPKILCTHCYFVKFTKTDNNSTFNINSSCLSLQLHTTMACPWTTPCSACPPTSRLDLKRETWPTTWATKQRGCMLTKVS